MIMHKKVEKKEDRDNNQSPHPKSVLRETVCDVFGECVCAPRRTRRERVVETPFADEERHGGLEGWAALVRGGARVGAGERQMTSVDIAVSRWFFRVDDKVRNVLKNSECIAKRTNVEYYFNKIENANCENEFKNQ